jgi:hypothetical protein
MGSFSICVVHPPLEMVSLWAGMRTKAKWSPGLGVKVLGVVLLPAKRTRAIVRVTTPPSLVLPSGARRSLHKPWGKKELPV